MSSQLKLKQLITEFKSQNSSLNDVYIYSLQFAKIAQAFLAFGIQFTSIVSAGSSIECSERKYLQSWEVSLGDDPALLFFEVEEEEAIWKICPVGSRELSQFWFRVDLSVLLEFNAKIPDALRSRIELSKVSVFTESGYSWTLDSANTPEKICEYFFKDTFKFGYPHEKAEKIVKLEIDGKVYLPPPQPQENLGESSTIEESQKS